MDKRPRLRVSSKKKRKRSGKNRESGFENPKTVLMEKKHINEDNFLIKEAANITHATNADRNFNQRVEYEMSDCVSSISYDDSVKELLEILMRRGRNALLPKRDSGTTKFSTTISRYVQILDISKRDKGHKKLNTDNSEFFFSLVRHLVMNLDRLREYRSFMPLYLRNLYYTLSNEFACSTPRSSVFVTPEKVTEYVDSICCLLKCTRESLGLMACDSKSAFVGNIVVSRKDSDSVKTLKEDGRGLSQPYRINYNNIISVRPTDEPPQFILVVEKLTIFNVLCSSRFHRRMPCVMITGGGEPSLECRLFVKMVHESVQKPVFILVDCNPFGVEIFKTFKYGSNAMAFMSRNLVVSSSIMIGMFHSDLIEHNIDEATMIPLNKLDKVKLDGLKSQDWMPLEPTISKSLESMFKSERKADIEMIALQKGYDYWVDEYLLKRIVSHLKDIEKRNKRAQHLERKRRRVNANMVKGRLLKIHWRTIQKWNYEARHRKRKRRRCDL